MRCSRVALFMGEPEELFLRCGSSTECVKSLAAVSRSVAATPSDVFVDVCSASLEAPLSASLSSPHSAASVLVVGKQKGESLKKGAWELSLCG